MNEHIEIEYKILLDENTFYWILQDYQSLIQIDYIQVNYYFTNTILQQKKYMLRIREKDNSFELTLKRPIKNHRLETNVLLTPEEKDDFFSHRPITNEIIDLLKEDNINPLELENQFSLKTHRYDIILPEGILSLDENTYCQKHDYELEFEVKDEQEGYQQFLNIIHQYGLNYTKNCPSKIQRVLASGFVKKSV